MKKIDELKSLRKGILDMLFQDYKGEVEVSSNDKRLTIKQVSEAKVIANFNNPFYNNKALLLNFKGTFKKYYGKGSHSYNIYISKDLLLFLIDLIYKNEYQTIFLKDKFFKKLTKYILKEYNVEEKDLIKVGNYYFLK